MAVVAPESLTMGVNETEVKDEEELIYSCDHWDTIVVLCWRTSDVIPQYSMHV